MVINDAFTYYTTTCMLDKQNESSYNRPLRLISDKASCSTSHIFAEFVKLYDIQHTLIASVVSRESGQVVSRTITSMIAKLTPQLNS